MVPSPCAVRAARVACVGTFRHGAGSRTELDRLVRDCLLRFLRCQETRGDGRGRVDGFPEVKVGRCGWGGLGRFREVGGRTGARVEGLKAFGRVERDAEVAGKGWAERCGAGFWVNLRRSGAERGVSDAQSDRTKQRKNMG